MKNLLHSLTFAICFLLGSNSLLAQECAHTVVPLIVTTYNSTQEIDFEILNEEGEVVLNLEDILPDIQNYSVYQLELCLPVGCYTMNMTDSWGDGWENTSMILGLNCETTLVTLSDGFEGSYVFGVGEEGCTPVMFGCTDPEAENYDETATVDNGSCLYAGCTDQTAENYDPEADINDDSCIYAGCTDPEALNYDPEATIEDDSCEYFEPINDMCDSALVLTSALYLSFEAAEYDTVETDCWNDSGESDGIVGLWYSFTLPYNSSVEIETHSDSAEVAVDTRLSVFEACGGNLMTCDDDGGDTNLSRVTFDCGELEPGETYYLLVETTNGTETECSLSYEIEPCNDVIFGCTDPTSFNYDPLANADDGSCFDVNYSCDSTFVYIDMLTTDASSDFGWGLFLNGELIAEDYGFGMVNTHISQLCVEEGCYDLELYHSQGNGWSWGEITVSGITSEGYQDVLFNGTLEEGGFASYQIAIGDAECSQEILGCTNDEAINYNPQANTDDGSCAYSSWEGPMYSIWAPDNPFAAMLAPQPGIDQVDLKVSGIDPENPVEIIVRDMTGRILFQETYFTEARDLERTIVIDDFASGIHLVTITNGINRDVIRLIKQH